MSEPMQTLWFEDVGFLNEQMLDTPVGRFSIRQTGIFLAFGLIAWGASFISEDLVFKIVLAGAIFFSGVAVFTRKIKTVPPEVHLLYMMGIGRPLKTKQIAHQEIDNKNPPIESSSPLKSMKLSTTLSVPVKVVGLLKEPAGGKSLSGRSFEVSIDGVAYTKGFTDEEGFFCAYFVPDHYGLFRIEVTPEGFAESVQQILVEVKPREVTEIATAKAKN